MECNNIKSPNTVVNWANYIRDIMTEERIRRTKLCGVGTRVQVDESLFRGRRKYNRGRLLCGDLDAETADDKIFRGKNFGNRISGPWVVGLVEEGTNNVLMFYVERRDAPTLIQIIKDNVYEKTTIVSDGWPAYRGIVHLGYQHEENYVCLITGTNTQRIECECGHAKL
jgi:hypothetical protein